jgi:hypothetical protein
MRIFTIGFTQTSTESFFTRLARRYEHAPDLAPTGEALRCHRRLVAEYPRDRWDDLEVVHL